MIFTWTWWFIGSLGCFEIQKFMDQSHVKHAPKNVDVLIDCFQVVEVGRYASSYGTMTLPGSTTQDPEGIVTTHMQMDEDRWIPFGCFQK